MLWQLRAAECPRQAEEDLRSYILSNLPEVEQHLNFGGRQWKVIERMEVELRRPLQGKALKLQEELQGKGGKMQADLPWQSALTQESGEEELQMSDVLADRIPTWGNCGEDSDR